MDKVKPDFALLLRPTEDKSWSWYFHIDATVVMFEGDRILNPSDDTPRTAPEECAMANLRIHSQAGADMVRDGERGLYAWSFEYHDAYTVDLPRAEIMVKTLRDIRRKMDKVDARLGSADRFATYVMRVALALDISKFVVLSGTTYDDYRVLDNGSAIYWIDAQERGFIDKVNGKVD